MSALMLFVKRGQNQSFGNCYCKCTDDANKIVPKLFWNVSHPTETATEAKKKNTASISL